ncbi:MAG: endonuclease III [Desulfobacteraceae bacterium]|nr:endonuclease III [Desulfobacteraceae bacterium]
MNNNTHRADKVQKILKSRYTDVKTQLKHNSPFQLLVATILSAQCTDRQVNAVTPALFQKLKTPADFAAVPVKTLEKLIHSTGFYRNKSRNIKACAGTLLAEFNGIVPSNINDLVRLPGVGRKTANVVLGAAFGVPGMVVDTHVARISRRLGLTGHKNPHKIELDLMKVIPRRQWSIFSLRLVYFGRDICQARKPRCPVCPLADHCPYPEKTAATG